MISLIRKIPTNKCKNTEGIRKLPWSQHDSNICYRQVPPMDANIGEQKFDEKDITPLSKFLFHYNYQFPMHK